MICYYFLVDLSSGSVADGQVSYRIAFGSKVPVRSRRAPLKEVSHSASSQDF